MAWATPLIDRISDKFRVGDGCWLWTAGRDNYGYGKIKGEDRSTLSGHRVIYELLVGPIQPGMELDHLCRDRACVRPDHLDPVPHSVNVARGDAGKHQAKKTRCPQGHPFDATNTYIRKDRPNSRGCRICRDEATRRYQQRRASDGLVSF